MKSKILALCITVLVITLIFSGCFEEKKDEEETTVESKTIYVDGDGGQDYTSIQDAVNASSDGDEIFVYYGTYNEIIKINKKITLVGENKDNTIIDGNNKASVVNISANNVKITGFTIQNASRNTPENVIIIGQIELAGIRCLSNDNIISNVLIRNCDRGILLINSNNNIIKDNYLEGTGIYTEKCKYNVFSGNVINNAHSAITLSEESTHNTVKLNDLNSNKYAMNLEENSHFNDINNNTMNNNDWWGIRVATNNNSICNNMFNNNGEQGIEINNGYKNIIKYNTFIKCEMGVGVYYTNNNSIQSNTFINNTKYGIFIQDSDYNKIIGNDITNNGTLDITLNIGIVRGHNNSIYKNNFRNNSGHIYSHIDGDNTWYNNSLKKGNYWDDYSGTDSDGDGIGDTPYEIYGCNDQDLYPLVNLVDI